MAGDRGLVGRIMPGGFMQAMGFRLVEWEEGRAVFEIALGPEHLNLRGVVHGGVLMSLLDAALSWSGLYDPDPARERRCLTLSMSTSFVGQVEGGLLRATGLRRGGGRQIFMATGEVRDAAGNLVALGEGVFRLRSDSVGEEGEAKRKPGPLALGERGGKRA